MALLIKDKLAPPQQKSKYSETLHKFKATETQVY